MACCVLAAMLMSQLLAAWQMRRRIALFAVLIAATGGALAFELDRHREHLRQLAWDARAVLRGEDPAVAALTRPAPRCGTKIQPTPASPDAHIFIGNHSFGNQQHAD